MSTKSPRPEAESDSSYRPCPECGARGWVDNRCLTPDHAHRCSYCDGRGSNNSGQDCYACHGTGMIEVRKVDKNPCPLCNGAGVYPVPSGLIFDQFAFKPGVIE